MLPCSQGYIFWPPPPPKKNREELTDKEKKVRGKRKEKREIGSKIEGYYSYFVALFNIVSYESKKTGENFKKYQGGGEDYSKWP